MNDSLLVLLFAVAVAAIFYLSARSADKLHISQPALASALQFAAGLIFGLVIISLMPDAIYHAPLVGVLMAFFLGGVAFVLFEYFSNKTSAGQESGGEYADASKGFYLAVLLDLFVDAAVIGIGMTIDFWTGVLFSIGIVLQMVPLVFVMMSKAREQQLPKKSIQRLTWAVPLITIAGVIIGFGLLQRQPDAVMYIVMALASGFLITAVTQSMIPASMSDRGKPSLAALFFLIGLTLYAALAFMGS